MQYLDLVEEFDNIESVDINHNGYEVVVHGWKDDDYHQSKQKFTFNKTGKEFAKQVQNFAALKKARKLG
jgi:hypothetical protein